MNDKPDWYDNQFAAMLYNDTTRLVGVLECIDRGYQVSVRIPGATEDAFYPNDEQSETIRGWYHSYISECLAEVNSKLVELGFAPQEYAPAASQKVAA